MIIKRKYVPLGLLYRLDPASKEVIDFAYSKMSKEDTEYNLEANFETTLWNVEMGACIPNLGYIKEEFKKLDKTNPYDNHRKLEEVNESVIVDSAPNKIVIHLMASNVVYHCTEIIKVVTIRK